MEEILKNSSSNIFATLAKDLPISHYLNQSLLILRANDLILPKQSPLRTSLLGSEVNKPFKNLIKLLNVIEYIELDIQNTKAPGIDDLIIQNV